MNGMKYNKPIQGTGVTGACLADRLQHSLKWTPILLTTTARVHPTQVAADGGRQ